MHIAIIGAGFTGLAAGWELVKQGHKVTIFEKELLPGGLAVGFRQPEWQWSVEKHYHHWFTNDNYILSLAQEIGWKTIITRPKTSVLVQDEIYPFDSVLNVLTFPKLTLAERIQMGGSLAILRLNPFWKSLEKYRARDVLPKLLGQHAYTTLWEPLLYGKFGDEAENISLTWFWARIKKRTPSLAYPWGGFLSFAQALDIEIRRKGGEFIYNADVQQIKSLSNNKIEISLTGSTKTKSKKFDAVIVTLPTKLFLRLSPQIHENYKNKYGILGGLGAINVILRLREPLMADGTYWLNICDKNAPVIAIVEHTNFMDKKYYNNEHIVYAGAYISASHPYFYMKKSDILQKITPLLNRLNTSWRKNLIDYELFTTPFAQPIMKLHYSRIAPPLETPLQNVWLANIEQIFPWDRGTNYAVELGQRVARHITA